VRIGRELGLPVFITIRGFEHEYVQTPHVGAQMVRALREADGCVAVSQSLGELAIAHGVPRDRVRVVHNAVDSGMFRHLDRGGARQRLGLDPGLRLVVSVGQLIARKRHHVLIEAFAQALARQPGARLAIIGGESLEPEYPRRLRDLAQRLGVAGSVGFHGNLEPAAVAEWLAAADVFALATAREGCCNAVLEALATGLPVVTTPVGDNACFVREGDNGMLVPVDDAGAMADALTAVLAGGIATPREAIAAALQRQVGGWDAVAMRVLEFFGERLDARRSAARERMT
jgi:glycosyltransferase involved in cell wall biosynthesis